MEVVVDRETPVHIHVTRKKGGSTLSTAAASKTISFARVSDAENSPPAVYTTSRKGVRTGDSSSAGRRHVADKDFDLPTGSGSSTAKHTRQLRQGVPEAASNSLPDYEGSEPAIEYYGDNPTTMQMTDAEDEEDVRAQLAESLTKIRKLEHTVSDPRYVAGVLKSFKFRIYGTKL